ncbi:MAG TPA: WecB/TagA/CpsF family glycosyltransferase [Steroidobacteraceae bacterium]|nr:WecB/TagA/CpsF family glycosyltransferase [Steroidobacteraceae bacterium]
MRANPSAGLAQTCIHQLDDFELEGFLAVAARFGSSRFGFVVTPNVDHMIRCHEDAAFRSRYASADFALLDSRFAARLLRLVKGVRLPVCTGSDLTEALFRKVIAADDRVVLIGGSPEQAAQITARFGLGNVRHHNPPMGFIGDPAAVEDCLTFIEQASPFRFCFLAVGSPQQETVATLLRQRGVARGLAFCIGASLNFLTGEERRAPLWMQQLSLEWLYRLAQDPRRLWVRYLVRGPRIFAHLRQAQVVLRKASPLPVGDLPGDGLPSRP